MFCERGWYGWNYCLSLMMLGGLILQASLLPAEPGMPDVGKSAAAQEYRQKCGLIRAAGVYCAWPDESFQATDNQFVIAILGKESDPEIANEFFRQLNQIGNRKIVLKRIRSFADRPACQILYLTADVSDAVQAKAIQELSGKPVLLIGESSRFAARGGCLNFVSNGHGNSVLQMNPNALSGQKVTVDVRLRKIAKPVDVSS